MDFKKDVLERSFDLPVLVDFWAPWCGPCQYLGPTLEELDKEQDHWQLVKVNVDENPQLSSQYGIKGIPDVKLFSKGQVIGGFTGARQKYEIEKWLQENLPDERLEHLSQLVEKAETSTEGLHALENFVSEHPDLLAAKLALSMLVVWDNPQKAAGLLAGSNVTNPFYDNVSAVNILVELSEAKLKPETKIETLLVEARNSLSEREIGKAVENMIDAVVVDKNYLDDLPRRAAIAVFTILGPSHTITKQYRRRFDMALY